MHYVYLLKCADGSFYCGYTTDPARRVKEHNESPRGAKCTRSRRPVELVYTESFETKSEALSREYNLKKLNHSEKAELISNA